MNMNQDSRITECYESIKNEIPFVPKLALILGSGLGDYADTLEVVKTIPYGEIKNFPRSTVEGHKGQFVFARIEGVPAVLMQGRVHYYEGYPMQEVVLPVRLMRRMGAEILFLTNAAGGVNYDFHAGDLMMITDQISSFVPSALIGPNQETLGPRFPDMSEIYDREYQKVIRDASEALDIPIQEGVYMQFTGPAYESPAEVRMARILGADAVGMSTACEAVAANHMGMKIMGISFISNLACGMTNQPLSHIEVQQAADAAAPAFCGLVTEVIRRIGLKRSK
jgi:purine-nucleoside phosphorylase